MTSLIDIQTELTDNIKFQVTPIPMTISDYASFTLQGVKRLYVDEGIEDNFKADYNKISNTLLRDLTLTEIEYCWICAEIAFRGQIKDDINAIIGYSCDAISITGANLPYKNAEATIQTLEDRLAKLSFKFSHKPHAISRSQFDIDSYNDQEEYFFNNYPYQGGYTPWKFKLTSEIIPYKL